MQYDYEHMNHVTWLESKEANELRMHAFLDENIRVNLWLYYVILLILHNFQTLTRKKSNQWARNFDANGGQLWTKNKSWLPSGCELNS